MAALRPHAWALGGLGVLGLLAWASVATGPAPLQDAVGEPPLVGTGDAEPGPEPAAPPAAAVEAEQARGEVHALVPEYPRSVSIPIGHLEANGNPVTLVAFHTEDTPAEVAAWYTAVFRREGRRVRTQPDPQGSGLSVTFYDAARGVLVGVAALPLPRAKGQKPLTLGLPSVTKVEEGVQLRPEAPSDFPTAKDALTVLRLDDQTPGPTQGSQTLVNMVPGKPRAVAEQYLQSLAEQGYDVVSQAAREGTEVLEFKGPRETVRMTVSRAGGGEAAASPESMVTIIRERRREEGRP
jgi:hypothetical protein